MSFNAIEKRGFRCTAEGIAISIVRDKARSAPLMLIRLAPDVMAAAGLNRADRVEVALGALRDDGLLRLASNPKGWAICRSSKECRTFSVGVPAAWLPAGSAHLSTAVKWHMAEDGAVLIVLPGWAKAPTKGATK